MSKLFREWFENVDEDSQEYLDFLKQQEHDDQWEAWQEFYNKYKGEKTE